MCPEPLILISLYHFGNYKKKKAIIPHNPINEFYLIIVHCVLMRGVQLVLLVEYQVIQNTYMVMRFVIK